MGFGEAVRTCVAKTFTWDGRATRSEFWWFVLAEFLLAIAGGILIAVVVHATGSRGLGLLIRVLLDIAIVVPGLAVTIRRLHDSGRSGGWWWIQLIPCAGGIVLFIFMLLPSEPHANDWGPDPLRPDIPRVTPRPPRPAPKPREYRCPNETCAMYGIRVDRETCVDCGEPTGTPESTRRPHP